MKRTPGKVSLALILSLIFALFSVNFTAFAEGNAVKGANGTYATIAEAIAAGETDLTLTANLTESVTIPANKTVTLTIEDGVTLTNEAGKHTVTVEKGAELTLKGSGTVDNEVHARGALVNNGTTTLTGSVKLTRSKEAGSSASNNGGNSWYVVDNHGTLTIEENASVKATGLYSSLIRNMGNSASDTAKIYVKGGELENQFIALKNDDFSELYVSGGTITSPEQAIQNWTKAEVTGGTLDGDVYTWNWSSEPSTTTISGENTVVKGNVVGVNYYADPNHVPNGPQITVTDGASVSGDVILANYTNQGLSKADPKADDTKGSIKVTGEDTKINTDKSGDDAFIDPSFCAEHVWGEKVTVQPTEFTTGTKVIYCTRCNTVDHEESIDMLPSTVGHTHRWGEWKVVKEATTTETGLKERTCATCGKTESEVIPVLTEPSQPTTPSDPAIPIPVDHPEGTPAEPSAPSEPADEPTVPQPPQTGSHSWIFVSLAAVAAGAAALVVLRKKSLKD